MHARLVRSQCHKGHTDAMQLLKNIEVDRSPQRFTGTACKDVVYVTENSSTGNDLFTMQENDKSMPVQGCRLVSSRRRAQSGQAGGLVPRGARQEAVGP